MKKLGIIGYRGMVGSVLASQMIKNNDFINFDTTLFSTSEYKKESLKSFNIDLGLVENANNLDALAQMDILLSTQGSQYTNNVINQLRQRSWGGYWIDAASSLRMNSDAMIVLDPMNRKQIDQAINQGIKNFTGGNCTVSLMMLAIDGLLKNNLVESISAMTYQAISGAGAKAIKELFCQYQNLITDLDLTDSVLSLEEILKDKIHYKGFPKSKIMAPLAFNILPWIDSQLEDGQTKEEQKAYDELNKILDSDILVDGICTRVPTLRAHSQALTIKLTKNLEISEIEDIIKNANKWIRYVENEKEASLTQLTPLAVTGTLDIAVGRLKKSKLGSNMIHLFTVGDQLLWGAAEPLRRVLNIINDKT